MPWVYLTDHWDEHPKLISAYGRDPKALVLFFASLAYCRRNSSDGMILGPKVPGLLGWSRKAQAVLVDLVLWHDVMDGAAIEIHDWAQWNRAAAGRSASARNAAQARWKDRSDA